MGKKSRYKFGDDMPSTKLAQSDWNQIGFYGRNLRVSCIGFSPVRVAHRDGYRESGRAFTELIIKEYHHGPVKSFPEDDTFRSGPVIDRSILTEAQAFDNEQAAKREASKKAIAGLRARRNKKKS